MTMSFVLRLPEGQRHRFDTTLGHLIPGGEITQERIEDYIPKGAIVVSVGDVTSATLLKNGILPDIAIVDYATKRGECHDFSVELDNYANMGKNTDIWERAFTLQKLRALNPKERISSELWDTIKRCYHELVRTQTHGPARPGEVLPEKSQEPASSNKNIYKNSQQPSHHPKRNIYLIVVQGEEDLAILPAIIEAPVAPSSSDELKNTEGQPLEAIRTVIIYGIPDKGIDIFEPDEEIKNTALDIVRHMEVEHGTRDRI